MRLTAAQALVRFSPRGTSSATWAEHRFFGGCFGNFGHGNVGGIGEALYENPERTPGVQERVHGGFRPICACNKT